MKFTQIPSNTFQQLQFNAGILLKNFTPETGSFQADDILFATTGGLQFRDNVSFLDYGEDIDNCPNNMMELKKIDNHEVTLAGTALSINVNSVKGLIGAADVSGNKVTPRNDLTAADFDDIWWVGDYGDKNTGANSGFAAIHIMNALNTDGFQLNTGKKEKGQFPFTYTGHYSMSAQDTVPYEVYIKAGE